MRVNNRAVMMQQGSGSFNVQSSLDVRDIATMAQFLVRQGEIKGGTYGQIINWCFELSLTYLRRQYAQELQEYELIEDALNALKQLDYSIAQFKGGGNKQLIRGMKNEALQRDFGTTIGQQYTGGAARPEHSMEYSSSPEYQRPKETSEYTPQAKPTSVPLEMAEAAARQLYEMTGDKHPDFLYLWDRTLIPPHWNEEQRSNHAQATAYMQKIMPEYLEQQEERLRPRTEEEVQANLREGTIKLLLKNATSLQQMPIPKELEPFTLEPSVIAEVAQRLQPYIEQRERDATAHEAEKKKRLEETARRQVGA